MNANTLLPFDASHCFIGGKWQSAASGNILQLHNPSDGTRLCQVAAGSTDDIDVAIDRSGVSVNPVMVVRKVLKLCTDSQQQKL